MFGSQDSRTVMTLGKLISSEHQLKLFRRSQETLGKYVVHYRPKSLHIVKMQGFVLYFPQSVRNIQNRKCQNFCLFFCACIRCG